MPIKVDLLRPDDLLDLTIEGLNLKLDTADPAHPVLVPEQTDHPSYLVVHFPPQTIVEEAFFETGALQPPPAERGNPYNDPPPSGLGAGDPANGARARIGGATRLVYLVPPGAHIPYTLEGLLDWTSLTLNVSPLADIPENPTGDQRNNAPAIQPPDPLETAIELPYRLVLSPAHDVIWDHAKSLKTHGGRTELWHARLAFKDAKDNIIPFSRAHPAPLRVIWSPDYHANKFLKTDQPVMGNPDLDWDYPPGVLTAMTPSDRHELVVLTSAFHGYIQGRQDDGSIDYSDYVPLPIHAEQVILSALGGWLKSRGNWRPPMPWQSWLDLPLPWHKQWNGLLDAFKQFHPGPDHPPRPRVEFLDAPARSGNDWTRPGAEKIRLRWPPIPEGRAGDSLNISEWVHIATQGRDHYVRIVYEGFLYPFRHRAALVKVTERKISDGTHGSPVAYLAQRMFIVVRQPLMDYAQARAGDDPYGREMPFNTVRLTTTITPDIDMPAPVAGSFSFWVMVNSAPFKFNAVATDIEGNAVDFSTALLFIPFSDYDAGTVSQVRQKYLDRMDWRACAVPGQPVTYAERKDAGAPDNTTLTTRALHFSTDDVTGPGGAYTFRPLLFKAEVNLPAVEQLLGTHAPTQIAYFDKYISGGFADPANSTGLFATIAQETKAGSLTLDKIKAEFSAQQAGGISTPNLSISGLAREIGPVAGDNLANIANDVFDPKDFFKDVKDLAKIFGSISLLDLLPGGAMGSSAPKVQFSQEPVSGKPNARKLVATLDWKPPVHTAGFGIVSLNATTNTKLEIDGRIEKVVEFPPSAGPNGAHALFEGSLKLFDIEFVHVILVHFQEFHFKSETGSKTAVNVSLDAKPVEFKDEFSFVNKLQDVIPPGLFGDGASLDLTPTYVKAGFAVGLPPLGVGVFDLENLVLGASLELPFLDGKPLFEFNISSREHPFNLTVAFLGGGGFFHLQLDTSGVRQLEVALEFGASASIDLGVASGGVHIMAGIYFSMGKKDGSDYAILSGYLRMGGELSVLGLISVSLEFYLTFGYENGKAAGRATLTVKVEVLCFSKSVDITVEKKFGGSRGDPKFFQVFETPAVWNEYASAFA